MVKISDRKRYLSKWNELQTWSDRRCFFMRNQFIRNFSQIALLTQETNEAELFARCSLLYTRCSLLFARCSLLFARWSLLFARCSLLLLVARYFLLDARYFLFLARYFLLVILCSLLVIFSSKLLWNKVTVSRKKMVWL